MKNEGIVALVIFIFLFFSAIFLTAIVSELTTESSFASLVLD